jgi:hypothetical protein
MARDRRHRATRKEIAKIAGTAKIAEIERPAIAEHRERPKPPARIRKLKITCGFL